MFVVMGATGHVGGAVVRALLAKGREVGAIVHDTAKAGPLKEAGAAIIVADIDEPDSLRAALRAGERAFLLNPPAPPDGDVDAREVETGRAIAQAARGAGLQKVVVASTYGARPGQGVGDLTSLYAFEQAIARIKVPAAVNRGAYYFTNLDSLLDEAREGRITTMFPADFRLPMVDPADLGVAAARRLVSGLDDVGTIGVEGSRQYSFTDVASAFSAALDRDVAVGVLPREQWEGAFEKLGFSKSAARSYARMTETVVEDGAPERVEKGESTLEAYVERLVANPS